jgi:RNA polymerase sigma factor (sigma-70 family)
METRRLTLEDELRLTRAVERAEASMARAIVRVPAALGVLAEIGEGVLGGEIHAREVTRIAAQAPGAAEANRARLLAVLERASSARATSTPAALGRLATELSSLRLQADVFERAAATMRDADARPRRAFARARRASRAAKAEWIAASAHLVVAIARRYRRPGVDTSDLVQDGSIGLIKAVERFDPTMGHRFSVYAAWWIRQHIFRALAEYGRTIRVPLPMVEASHRVARARRVFEGIHGREPEDAELAAASGLDLGTVAAVNAIAGEPVSFHGRLDDPDADMLDRIADRSAAPADELVASHRLHDRVRALLAALPRVERDVMRLRFGLEGAREHTLVEVATALGVSRDRARRTEERALGRLRAWSVREGLGGHLAA